MNKEERKRQRELEKEIEIKYIKLIREAFSKGDKEEAKRLLRELATKINFPRLEDVLKEYDEYKPGSKLVWGLWGPEDDLIAKYHIESSKPPKTPRKRGKREPGLEDVQGAQFVAAMEEETCDLCAGLNGIGFCYPSALYDKYNQLLHDGCDFLWMYVDKEETNYHPDKNIEKKILKTVNEDPKRGNYGSIEELIEKCHGCKIVNEDSKQGNYESIEDPFKKCCGFETVKLVSGSAPAKVTESEKISPRGKSILNWFCMVVLIVGGGLFVLLLILLFRIFG
ncbi:MAG: hypothetical protein AB9903_02055 [Vulcanimicrobiota bacterium]